jgi:uncharacterized membrane protein
MNATAASLSIAVGAALAGAAAMYLLDPQAGGRRRAQLRDQLNRGAGDAYDFLRKVPVDAGNRARGLYSESRARLQRGRISDETLQARIRAQLGRLVSHPRAIEVTCTQGVARLRGSVLEHEVDRLLSSLRRVRGVTDVVNELEVHSSAERVPALQGHEIDRRSSRLEYLQGNWSPAPRVLAGAIGTAMLAASWRAQPGIAGALGTLGAAILVRAIANRPLGKLIGIAAAPEDGILVQRTIDVYADADEAYSAWREFENFPTFMSHVREIARIDDRRYRWTVDGPGNVPVSWEAEVTADVPNELIAWHTAPDSLVQSTGVIQFEPTSYGGTRVHIRMSYRPPANQVGHAVARIFGKDPQRQLDDDLQRFKAYVEIGKTAGDHVAATRH